MGTRTLELAGGDTERFRLQLRRGARRRLAQQGSLRVTAVARLPRCGGQRRSRPGWPYACWRLGGA